MGREVFYKRKLADKICSNGDDYEKATKRNHCTCKEENWECDVGFYREDSGMCTRMKKKVDAGMV